MRFRQIVAGILFSLMVSGVANAKPSFDSELSRLEEQLSACEKDFSAHGRSVTKDPEERLQEGLVMQAAGDHQRASYIFMDIVYHEEWRGLPAYQAAQLQLAISLYEDGYYRLSQRYLIDLVKNGRGSERVDGVVLLLQVAVKTWDWAEVNALLADDSTFNSTSTYQYVLGRALLLQNDLDNAVGCLEKASKGSDEWAVKGAYLLGVVQIQNKKFEEALSNYKKVASSTLEFRGSNAVHELAILAQARIYYELEKWSDAIDCYRQIPETSSNFPAVLYEMGWAHVRQEDYESAKQKFELLLLAYPDERHALETRRLLADISRELGQYDDAVASYQKLVDEFEPVMTQMESEAGKLDERRLQIKEKIENGRYEDVQIVPERAKGMVPVGTDVGRVETMLNNLEESHKNSQDSDAIIAEIRAALDSDENIRNLPEFQRFTHRSRDIRINALLIGFQVLELSGNVSTEFELLAEDLRQLPRSQDERNIYLANLSAEREVREARLHRLKLSAESLRHRTNILKTWLNDGHAASLSDEEKQKLEDQLALFEQELSVLTANQEEIESMLTVMRNSSGSSDEAEWSRQIMEFESNLNGQLKDESEDSARVRAILSRLDKLDAEIESSIQVRVSDFKARLEREITMHELEKERYLTVKVDVGVTAGDVSSRYWQLVYEQVRDMVLNADLGMVDIAWLQKDARSKALSAAMEERRKEREVLEQDFRQFLKESGQE